MSTTVDAAKRKRGRPSGRAEDRCRRILISLPPQLDDWLKKHANKSRTVQDLIAEAISSENKISKSP
jgi:hypothetical protein